MYHSITFGEKNTWTDWHLVPSSRPVINPPKPKTQYVDIPGADGSIDLTESLAGRPVFSDREGSLDFIVLNDFNVDGYDYNWIEVYTSVMQYLHGQHMRMVLDDDPNYYYEGRFAVNSWKSDRSNSTITIDYVVGPYKYETATAITTNDLIIGSLAPSGSGQNFTIDEVSSTNMARLKTPPRAYFAGDSVRVKKGYQIDVAMYSGTAGSPTAKDFISYSALNGNGYTFEDSGFYRLNVRKNNYITTSISSSDLPELAAAIIVHKGGVL